jgi:hypothetical protein
VPSVAIAPAYPGTGKKATANKIISARTTDASLDCGRQFVGGHNIICRSCLPWVAGLIKTMLIRRIGIQYGTENQRHQGRPQIGYLCDKSEKKHHDCLEIDEFWTYVGKKKNKVWLIYAYHRESGEIAAYVWGKRDIKTAKKLMERIKGLGISYGRVSTDNWDSFLRSSGKTRIRQGSSIR